MKRIMLAFSLSLLMALFVGCSTPHTKTGVISLPTATPQPLAGVKAITPSGETVSQNDVMKYVQTHNLPFNGAPLSDHKVVSITLQTIKEVNVFLDRKNPALPDNYRVWFVAFTGKFIFPHPPVSHGNEQAFMNDSAFEVFDEKTGNLLMGGVLPPPVLSRNKKA